MRYVVVKVVPDPIRYEPVNIGVIVHDPETGQVRSRFTDSIPRLRTYADERLDVDTIQRIVDGFEKFVAAPNWNRNLLDGLAKDFTQVIEISDPNSTAARDINEETVSLYNRLISLDQRGRRETGRVRRSTVVARVRRAFERYHVPVITERRFAGVKSSYTFDFALEADTIRTFQCFSFGLNQHETVDDAKVLVYSLRDIVERARSHSERRLSNLVVTAFVNPPSEATEQSEAVRSILEEVATVRDPGLGLDSFVESLSVA